MAIVHPCLPAKLIRTVKRVAVEIEQSLSAIVAAALRAHLDTAHKSGGSHEN